MANYLRVKSWGLFLFWIFLLAFVIPAVAFADSKVLAFLVLIVFIESGRITVRHCYQLMEILK